MVKCLTHGLRGFNGAVQRRLATLTVTVLISSCWQLSSEVELRRIFDVCKRWANSSVHEFVEKNMFRHMRPHGRFAHCSCKNAVRQPPVLASCIEIYYFASLDRLRSWLSDQKERNFRVRLEIKGKKSSTTKKIYNFLNLLSAHLMSIFSVLISYVHWLSGNEIK